MWTIGTYWSLHNNGTKASHRKKNIKRKKKVIDFIRDPNGENSLEVFETSDYIFWGPREDELALESFRFNFAMVYETQEVLIYKITK